MLALFAQAGRNKNANNDGDDLPPEFFAIYLVVFCVAFVIWLIVSYFFMSSLSNALKQCRPRNQRMDPGQVWLNLIPLFNIFWMFHTVSSVSDSLRREFRSRGWRARENFGQTWGIVFSVVNILTCGCYISGLPPIILLVVYWSKIVAYTRELASDYDDDEDEWEDDDDDPDDDERDNRRGRGRREEYDDDPRDDDDRARGRRDRPWDRH